MKKLSRFHFVLSFVSLVLGALWLPATAAAVTVWGSFSELRINYPAGALSGSAHATLRSVIQANDGILAPPTASLSASYLSTVDVFYTSLLSTVTGELNAPEQSNLASWIAAGGTLIVTADAASFGGYESFTSAYGVGGYTLGTGAGSATPTAPHPITDAVGSYQPAGHSTFSTGADALQLGNDSDGGLFMAVLEPATGFVAGGRIFVIGDHNIFTEDSIFLQDHLELASNLAAWAAAPFDLKCVLDLQLGYAANNLSLDFKIGSTEPMVWGAWLWTGQQITPLWSIPLPSLQPAFDVPISFPFPQIGTIGIITGLTSSDGLECVELEVVDTGS